MLRIWAAWASRREHPGRARNAAMKQTSRNGLGRGFTLVELMVTITIVAVLAALSFSMVKRTMQRSKLTASVSKVKDLGTFVHSYVADHGGRLPVWKDGEVYWWEQLADEDEYDMEMLYRSPAHQGFRADDLEGTISYGWNAAVVGKSGAAGEAEDAGPRRLVSFRRPGKVLVLADGARERGFGLIEAGGPVPDPERYAGKAAGLLLDGSARTFDALEDFKADSEWLRMPEI